jgi:HD-GYP domain-containing protein (c-di-GMP phosphodiesterase class II)
VAAGEARGGAEPDAGLEEDAMAVGARLGMTDSDLKALGLGIRFHDLGKIALSDEILQKPGQLTPDERRAMERYPVAGERILSPFDFLEEVRGVVRHEHERWDGQGYPDGLAGEAIPLGSRVIHAAVAYHAMLAPRPYREALRPEQARAELRHNAGAQFDPRVVRELIAWLEEKEAAQAADSDSSSARQSRSTLAS